jgi:hypothetical protein
MARKKGDGKKGGTSSASPQTTEELSDDQLYSLTEQHRQKYERLIAAKKAADKAVRDFGKIIKADLGPSGLQDIKDLISLATPEGEAAMKEAMERQARVMRWMNIPIGTQGGLFEETDRTPIAERAYSEGKRQGLAGESCNNPHHVSTEAHREHNRGYADGQETKARNGFKKLEDEPQGPIPRDEWQRRTADENAAVQQAIKDGTVAQLGTRQPTHTISQ